MRTALAAIPLVFSTSMCFGQGPATPPAFDVASVKASQRALGKDAGSQVLFGPAGVSGKNVTLKQLIVEAYRVQPHQVSGGPGWLDVGEYDVEAKADGPASKGELARMLRTLLADRFRLALHNETRDLSVYELVIDKLGPKIHPIEDGEGPAAKAGAGGFRFRGDLQHFANLLSVQLTIPVIDDPTKPSVASGTAVPVLDKTGLQGIYDIGVDIKLEPGGDMFTLWQRFLQDRLGLKLESRKEKVEVLVVDRAERAPTEN
jgi:uncharacterized protein (TIGR03435 family)